jgi:hypothetical protein
MYSCDLIDGSSCPYTSKSELSRHLPEAAGAQNGMTACSGTMNDKRRHPPCTQQCFCPWEACMRHKSDGTMNEKNRHYRHINANDLSGHQSFYPREDCRQWRKKLRSLKASRKFRRRSDLTRIRLKTWIGSSSIGGPSHAMASSHRIRMVGPLSAEDVQAALDDVFRECRNLEHQLKRIKSTACQLNADLEDT